MIELCDLTPITEMYGQQNISQRELKNLSDEELEKSKKMYERQMEEVREETKFDKRYDTFAIKSTLESIKENLKAVNNEIYRRKTELENIESRKYESADDSLYKKFGQKRLSSIIMDQLKDKNSIS